MAITTTNPEAADQGVRFSNVNQQIEPDIDDHDSAEAASAESRARQQVPRDIQDTLRDLSLTMQKSQVQSKRMEHFAFEPVSMPSSRVFISSSDSQLHHAYLSSQAPSPSSGSRHGSRQHSSQTSPLASQTHSAAHSPPLTPEASNSQAVRPVKPLGSSSNLANAYPPPSTITPQVSPPHDPGLSRPPAKNQALASPNAPSSRAVSPSGKRNDSDPAINSSSTSKPTGSAPQSREPSPARKPSDTPRNGSVPTAERESIYARNKRTPHPRGLEGIFGMSKDSRRSHGYNTSSETSSLKGTDAVGSDSRVHDNKRHSGFFGSRHHDEDAANHKHSGSMHDLKRFFKFGGKHKDKQPPSTSRNSSMSGSRTPTNHRDSTAVPFADDHGLESKYGKFGKVLGSGAGGSVRLMKRSTDGVTFAVKQFRPRHTYESEREYTKKVTAEFCVGSTLHHGNVIETMDIVHENGQWYEVMEYAPFDLFACVMTGKMSREETTCCIMQIISGVTYLHSMGLAHRDLKLDNIVVNEHGIMKLIDFGSAVVFRYPFEDEVVRASGIVGSDPYLAPEVYDDQKYDPQAVDVWSLAIIFCCMTLRRFPWKLPRLTDVSYKYFVAPPTPGTPSLEDLRRRQSGPATEKPSPSSSVPASAVTSASGNVQDGQEEARNDAVISASAVDRPKTPQGKEAQATPSVKGPWRLLRLLPRESRFIIGRMLDTDPAKRATLEEIHKDQWVSTRPFCIQGEDGAVIRAEGHSHVLEPGSSGGSK